MKLATLACLAALSLCVASAHAAPGDPSAKPDAPVSAASGSGAPSSAAPVSATPSSAPARVESAAAKAEPPRSEKAAGRPRRASYAACNRASHQRGYYGGRRRRFLIRCRLGYERPRANQHQAPAGPAPVRKP